MKYGQCVLPSIMVAQLYRIACIKLMRNTLETLWVSIGALYILTYCKSRKTTLLTYFLVISYGYTLLTCSKNTGSEESVFLRSIIVDDVGEQADNGQHAENDFAWVQTFTSFQSSERFSTASMMRSTTAPIAWKIGPSAIMRIASLQSICV